jgi:hypothetical protein
MASTIYNGKLLRFKFNDKKLMQRAVNLQYLLSRRDCNQDTDGTVSIQDILLQDRQRHYWQTYLQVIQRMLQQILC